MTVLLTRNHLLEVLICTTAMAVVCARTHVINWLT